MNKYKGQQKTLRSRNEIKRHKENELELQKRIARSKDNNGHSAHRRKINEIKLLSPGRDTRGGQEIQARSLSIPFSIYKKKQQYFVLIPNVGYYGFFKEKEEAIQWANIAI